MRRLAALVLLLAACAQTATQATETPGVGDMATDGQFTFVVESFECGETEVVNGIFSQQANGEFCHLDLVVTNTGDTGRSYATVAQRLVTYEDGRLTPSVEATLVVSPGKANEELNPGLSLETTAVFDVADGGEIEFALLRDSPLSQGVLVRLGQERG